MRQGRLGVALAIAALVAGSAACAAQADASFPIERRLSDFADRLRVSLSVAVVAAFSPSVADAHGHAEQLIVLLRGGGKDGSMGLLQEAASLTDWIAARSLDRSVEQPLLGAAGNVQEFLRLAAEAAVAANRDRALAVAVQDLSRVYAYLLAAWGQPVDGIAVPGLVMMLRAFGVPVTA